MPDYNAVRLVSINISRKTGFYNRFLFGSPLHVHQLPAWDIRNIIVYPALLGISMINQLAVLKCITAGTFHISEQDELKIFSQRGDQVFLVHIRSDLVNGKSANCPESKVEKGETHFIGKHHADTAVRHPFDQ